MDVAVALERQNMCGNSIEEVAVVRYDERTAGKVQKRLLKRPQSFHIEIVGGFVQYDDVRPRLEQLRELQPVAFPPRKVPHRRLLHPPPEPEPAHVGPALDEVGAELDLVLPLGDLVVDRFGGVEAVQALLADADHVHRGTDGDGAGVRILRAEEHLDQRRLSSTVGSNDADDTGRGEGKLQSFHEQTIPERFPHSTDVDDDVAEPRTRGNVNPAVVPQDLLRRPLRHELVVPLQPRFALVALRLDVATDPLELLLQQLVLGVVGAFLVGSAGGLGLEPGGVVSLEGDALAAVELEDPLGDVLEEIPVVGDADDRAFEAGEKLKKKPYNFGASSQDKNSKNVSKKIPAPATRRSRRQDDSSARPTATCRASPTADGPAPPSASLPPTARPSSHRSAAASARPPPARPSGRAPTDLPPR
mmetsp:Transcript_36251/g.84801  ORF Transcript_36251/g.84801 Transcript_36251/m.84801 type:complete len:418 (+) Transcript_36251:343-1596(+)